MALWLRKLSLEKAGFLAAAFLVWLACDSGETPTHQHDPPPDNGVCGHVDSAAGVSMVSHGDSLVQQYGGRPDPHYRNEIRVRQNGIVHGIHVTFLDDQGAPIEIAEDCTINHLEWQMAAGGFADITQDPGLRWYINIEGRRPGSTTLRVSLAHLTHSHYTSLDIPLIVLPPTE